jgi:hypothetical protein
MLVEIQYLKEVMKEMSIKILQRFLILALKFDIPITSNNLLRFKKLQEMHYV